MENGKHQLFQIQNIKVNGLKKKIPNPAYKGEWVRPEIANPDYKEHSDLHAQSGLKFVGFDLWQVKAGTVFNHLLITDSKEEAEKQRKEIEIFQKKEREESEAKEKKEREAAEEESKKRSAEEEEKKKAEEAKKAEEDEAAKNVEQRAEEIKKESADHKHKEAKDEL